jgi:hypothetical protein
LLGLIYSIFLHEPDEFVFIGNVNRVSIHNVLKEFFSVLRVNGSLERIPVINAQLLLSLQTAQLVSNCVVI